MDPVVLIEFSVVLSHSKSYLCITSLRIWPGCQHPQRRGGKAGASQARASAVVCSCFSIQTRLVFLLFACLKCWWARSGCPYMGFPSASSRLPESFWYEKLPAPCSSFLWHGNLCQEWSGSLGKTRQQSCGSRADCFNAVSEVIVLHWGCDVHGPRRPWMVDCPKAQASETSQLNNSTSLGKLSARALDARLDPGMWLCTQSPISTLHRKKCP